MALLDQWHVSTAEEVYRAMKARATPDSFVILVGVFGWLEVAVAVVVGCRCGERLDCPINDNGRHDQVNTLGQVRRTMSYQQIMFTISMFIFELESTSQRSQC